jgi:hypothetical protein
MIVHEATAATIGLIDCTFVLTIEEAAGDVNRGL